MASIFEQTIVPKIPFSNFPLIETQLVSQNFGQLVPCYVREVLPNDVFDLSCAADVSFAPMVAPMNHNCHHSTHFFFVPARIVFDDFETFITGSEDGHALTTEAELARMPHQPGIRLLDFYDMAYDPWDSAGQVSPWLDSSGDPMWQGSILDYLGLPNNLGIEHSLRVDPPSWTEEVISDIPLRSYFKIWYDYYRDENLQVDFTRKNGQTMTYYDFWRNWKRTDNYTQLESAADLMGAMNFMFPFYRAYKKDYFTGALQSPQKGEPVTINLGSSAPVTFDGTNSLFTIANNGLTTAIPSSPTGVTTSDITDTFFVGSGEGVKGNLMNKFEPAGGGGPILRRILTMQGALTGVTATADLSTASAITVEALREAFAVQEILESLSLRGSRFCEFLRGNFGVTPDDYRLQRPQFLGGLVSPVAVQKVLQTSGYSGSDNRDMTGYAAGRAFAAAGGHVFRMRFKEYGYIIGIGSVMPQSYYYQGIPRHFLRKDRFDYYMVQTAHLGEQAIENKELYFDPSNTSDVNNKVFGFIPRWAEYKTTLNGIHGDFRGSLNYYHMARVFGETPTLSKEFISTEGLQTRPFAVWKTENPSINHLIWIEYFFKVTASRAIPYHSLPKIQ